MEDIGRLNELSDATVREYLRRSNVAALENMVGLCLHAMTPREVIEVLRAQADFIESDLA